MTGQKQGLAFRKSSKICTELLGCAHWLGVKTSNVSSEHVMMEGLGAAGRESATLHSAEGLATNVKMTLLRYLKPWFRSIPNMKYATPCLWDCLTCYGLSCTGQCNHVHGGGACHKIFEAVSLCIEDGPCLPVFFVFFWFFSLIH